MLYRTVPKNNDELSILGFGCMRLPLTEKGQIAIPKEIRSKTFKKGSKIAILAYNDHIELRPMKQMETALASEKVLAKDWNTKEENKAWKNL